MSHSIGISEDQIPDQPNMEASTDIISAPGHFELPTPESLNPDIQSARGAVAASWDASDEEHATHAGDGQSDFPMVVWLRGDEPWFTQFNMDADGVMAALGIKRSRLTQISGRDLRVGRVRVDRYIRPVYRSIDVEQYLSWTRATASHQKSSDAIKIAVEQLQITSDAIQTTLDAVTTEFTSQIKDEMSTFIAAAVDEGMTPVITRMNAFQESVITLTESMRETVSASLAATIEQLNQTTEAMRETARQQSAALEILTLQMNQTSEKTAAMEERLAAWDNMLMNHIQTIAGDLAELKKPRPFRKKAANKTPKASGKQGLVPSAPKPNLALRAAPSRRKPK